MLGSCEPGNFEAGILAYYSGGNVIPGYRDTAQAGIQGIPSAYLRSIFSNKAERFQAGGRIGEIVHIQ